MLLIKLLGICYLVSISVGLVVAWFCMRRAPEGYQDEEGFHVGRPDTKNRQTGSERFRVDLIEDSASRAGLQDCVADGTRSKAATY